MRHALLALLFAVTLSFTDNSDNEDGFIVQKTISGDCSTGWYEVTRLGVNITVWADDLGQPGDCYRVDAFNADGESAFTNTAQVPTPVTLPTQPPPSCHGKGKRKC